MSPIGIALLLICGCAIFIVKPRNIPVVLLIGCCYMTVGQNMIIAGANFPFFRILVILGVLRTRANKPIERNYFDRLMFAWAIWTFFASFFHEFSPGSGPKFIFGKIIDLYGSYYIFRRNISDSDDIKHVARWTFFVMFPVAISMIVEQVAYHNVFSVLGGIPVVPAIRDGRIRAQGSFSHPILAGSIGAACFPLAVALWKDSKLISLISMSVAVVIVIASASSGPIMSIVFASVALGFWHFKHHFSKLKYIALTTYVGLSIVMSRPPYYVMSMIDLTGSSTGYHRAMLIEQSLKYLNEWWLFGTDRTVHWMPNQGRISEYHTDVTNYYLAFGVSAGLPAMLIVITVVLRSASKVGKIANDQTVPKEHRFTIWCVGAMLFANAATSMSVAFFGQATVFFWFAVGVLAGYKYKH